MFVLQVLRYLGEEAPGKERLAPALPGQHRATLPVVQSRCAVYRQYLPVVMCFNRVSSQSRTLGGLSWPFLSSDTI